jgi:hypothetical protein
MPRAHNESKPDTATSNNTNNLPQLVAGHGFDQDLPTPQGSNEFRMGSGVAVETGARRRHHQRPRPGIGAWRGESGKCGEEDGAGCGVDAEGGGGRPGDKLGTAAGDFRGAVVVDVRILYRPRLE